MKKWKILESCTPNYYKLFYSTYIYMSLLVNQKVVKPKTNETSSVGR